MAAQTITDLLGEDLAAYPLGEDLGGEELTNGYVPIREVDYIPQMTIGPGLVGPVPDQNLQIYRDNRPIAADELGQQGPFRLEINKYGRRAAGRTFPLNYEFGPAALDNGMVERVPEQDALRLSPFGPEQDPALFDGVPPPEILPATNTVFYTASPSVGWDGY